MPQYQVNQAYQASRDGRTFGPWEPGDTVELDDTDAEWVERDSPGTLARHGQEGASERSTQPARDRQHRGGRNREK